MTTPQMAPDRRSMRVSEWPPTDREIWRAALVAGDLLDKGGARAGHAEQSNAMVAAGYGYWLTWLAQQGLLDADCPPADRLQRDAVTTWVAEMQHRGLASNTLATRLQALHAMAGLQDGGKDWGWIRRIESRLRARHAPVRRKRERMVGAADLLSLGRTLMAEAPAQSTDRLRAMQYRDGLMIAFLAARPLRLRNLSDLELDRTVARRGDGWWIEIPSEETKTHAAIEVPWPEALTRSIRRETTCVEC